MLLDIYFKINMKQYVQEDWGKFYFSIMKTFQK